MGTDLPQLTEIPMDVQLFTRVSKKNKTFYYLPCTVFHPYRGYTERDRFFVYKWASVPWMLNVINFRFFTSVLESM